MNDLKIRALEAFENSYMSKLITFLKFLHLKPDNFRKAIPTTTTKVITSGLF